MKAKKLVFAKKKEKHDFLKSGVSCRPGAVFRGSGEKASLFAKPRKPDFFKKAEKKHVFLKNGVSCRPGAVLRGSTEPRPSQREPKNHVFRFFFGVFLASKKLEKKSKVDFRGTVSAPFSVGFWA